MTKQDIGASINMNQLTPWSRFLLKKNSHSARKFPAFYGNWIFIPVFTKACHCSL